MATVLIVLTSITEPVFATCPTDAYDFYCRYSSNTIIVSEDNLYFGTRSKKQTVPGYTYKTLGFTFQVTSNEEPEITVQLALGESIQEISEVLRTENGLPYSYNLFCLSGETLKEKMKTVCPEKNLTAVFAAGNNVTIYADSLMVVRLNGQAFGSIQENSSGLVDISGTVYTTEDGIAHAIPWAAGNNFRDKFNIKLELVLENFYSELMLRHIGKDYLFSLPSGSVWRENEACAELETGLSRSDDAPLLCWTMTTQQQTACRKMLEESNYAFRKANLEYIRQYIPS